jgi:hypothetical protein
VAGKEGDTPTGNLADDDRIARRAKRGIHHTLIAAVQQCVEPRTADHADGGFVRHGAQATFVPVLDDFPELPEPVLAPDFDSLEDEPDEDEPDEGVFWSVPEDFSVVDEEPVEEPFCCLSLDPLDADTRLSLR